MTQLFSSFSHVLTHQRVAKGKLLYAGQVQADPYAPLTTAKPSSRPMSTLYSDFPLVVYIIIIKWEVFQFSPRNE